MPITVMKFGGTSMDDIEQVSTLIQKEARHGRVIAVVSAFSKVTDQLLEVAATVIENPIKHKNELSWFLEPVLSRTMILVKDYLYTHNRNERTKNGEKMLSFLDKQIDTIIKDAAREIIDLQILKREDKEKTEKVNICIADRICGLGEVMSSYVLTEILESINQDKAKFHHVDLSTVLSPESEKKSEAYIDDKQLLFDDLIRIIKKRIRVNVERNQSSILSGYVGYIPGGILETIERGYTDATAALAANVALEIEDDVKLVRLQIWKEVPGLMSADPRIVEEKYGAQQKLAESFKTALLRRKVTFTEAAELSALAGMKAINANGIYALDGSNIPIEVRNTFEPRDPGTKIVYEINDADEEMKGVRFVSGKKKQIIYKISSNRMVNQKGVAAKIFDLCAELNIAIDAITTSATVVAFSIEDATQKKDELEENLGKIGKVIVYDKRALVCCIGNGFNQEKGLLSRLSGILAQNDINIDFDCGDADNNITFIIDEKDFDKAIKALHTALFSGNVQNSGD